MTLTAFSGEWAFWSSQSGQTSGMLFSFYLRQRIGKKHIPSSVICQPERPDSLVSLTSCLEFDIEFWAPWLYFCSSQNLNALSILFPVWQTPALSFKTAHWWGLPWPPHSPFPYPISTFFCCLMFYRSVCPHWMVSSIKSFQYLWRPSCTVPVLMLDGWLHLEMKAHGFYFWLFILWLELIEMLVWEPSPFPGGS